MSRLVVSIILIGFLAACAHQSSGDGDAVVSVSAPERIEGKDPILKANGGPLDTTSDDSLRVERFPGTGRLLNSRPADKGKGVASGADGVTLNFVEADVAKVAEAVLGQTLGLDYVIDPQVAAKITLRSRNPVAKEDVLGALEEAFALSGLGIVEAQGAYHIVPLGEAGQRSLGFDIASGRDIRPGFGVHIVKLSYINAGEMEKILLPLMPAGSSLTTDPARNLVFLKGTSGDVEAALEAIDIFDVNWLSAMSFALYTPSHASAEDLVEELVTIFENTSNPMAGRVEFMPLPRLNAILTMTAEPKLLSDVETWLRRLDRTGDGEEEQIFVYNVQHGTAEEITASLISILSDGGDRNGAADQGGGNDLQGGGGAAQEIKIGSANGARIVANNQNNAIMVYSGARAWQMILDAIKQIDVPVDQVLIEATIAEVTLNDQLKYGVQWFFENAENTFTQSSNSGGAVTSQFPGFSYSYFTTSAQVALNALESVTDVKVLSSPKLMTLNNKSGFLQVGDQVPVASQSAVSITDPSAPIVNSVQFRDTGVILEVTPRINSGGMVLLEVSQEVSDVIPTTTSGIDSPTIQQRKLNSTVTVEDGETIALGGLIRETHSKGKSGLPVLSRIPVLGAAFGSQDQSTRRTELLVFITPRVVRNTEDARAATDYLRSRLRNSKFFEATQ